MHHPVVLDAKKPKTNQVNRSLTEFSFCYHENLASRSSVQDWGRSDGVTEVQYSYLYFRNTGVSETLCFPHLKKNTFKSLSRLCETWHQLGFGQGFSKLFLFISKEVDGNVKCYKRLYEGGGKVVLQLKREMGLRATRADGASKKPGDLNCYNFCPQGGSGGLKRHICDTGHDWDCVTSETDWFLFGGGTHHLLVTQMNYLEIFQQQQWMDTKVHFLLPNFKDT